MIFDILGNIQNYVDMHEHFAKAFAFLERDDLAELAEGRHEIDGENVYAMVATGRGRDRADALLEVHDRYIDVQYVLAGVDEMGWKARFACVDSAEVYDERKDVAFYSDEPDAWLSTKPGSFAIFFPEDAHMPMISPGRLHKVVVKVAV